MKFMNKDFLLTSPTAQKLYHEYAASQPIYDYHCHLNPDEIANNRRFANLSEIWLGGDHYKWRAMRSNGIPESHISGKADPYEKFLAWAGTLPQLIGNPLYHWTHLELQRYFDIYEPLDTRTAPAIWQACNQKLQNDESLSISGIFKKFKVHTVGTTDDPADSLSSHEHIRSKSGLTTKVRPSFRPDKALNIDKAGFAQYIETLSKAAGKKITTLSELTSVLDARLDFFHSQGCLVSDHALEVPPCSFARDGSRGQKWETEVAESFQQGLAGGLVDAHQADSYKTWLLAWLGRAYHKRGWAMQLHLAALRNNNTRQFKTLGPDTGFDAVHDKEIAAKLAGFLDILDADDTLPKTILYSLNPKDYYSLGTLMGCFQGVGIPGKIQLGSAWWFCDHRDGMEEQLKVLGSLGLLPRFIGMLTDSRSFLSYPRHEYFRRILCNIIGNWADAGEIPNDLAMLGGIVSAVSFGNAERYFDLTPSNTAVTF